MMKRPPLIAICATRLVADAESTKPEPIEAEELDPEKL
jgi:hypothetical protein